MQAYKEHTIPLVNVAQVLSVETEAGEEDLYVLVEDKSSDCMDAIHYFQVRDGELKECNSVTLPHSRYLFEYEYCVLVLQDKFVTALHIVDDKLCVVARHLVRDMGDFTQIDQKGDTVLLWTRLDEDWCSVTIWKGGKEHYVRLMASAVVLHGSGVCALGDMCTFWKPGRVLDMTTIPLPEPHKSDTKVFSEQGEIVLVTKSGRVCHVYNDFTTEVSAFGHVTHVTYEDNTFKCHRGKRRMRTFYNLHLDLNDDSGTDCASDTE